METKMKIDKKEFFFIGIIFVISVIGYGVLASRMSGIVFYPGDETRFIAIAKSLHFSGNVSEHYMIESYDDILYPLLLSLGYFFYSPEHILDIFRMLGVILMSSAVFPVYFLARKMEIGKLFKLDGAMVVTVISVIIPELTYSAYVLSEVLLYPLFLWMLYIVYGECESKDTLSRLNILSIVLFFVMYMTKTFSIVFAATYCFVLFVCGILEKDRKMILKAILSGLIFLGMVLGLKGILYIMNGMQKGASHYDAQVTAIFPFTFQVFVALLRGVLFYGGYFILFTGIVPVLVLCSNFKIYNKKDRYYARFLLGLIVFTIMEIVIIIHFSENGLDENVSKFHYRYLFYFFLPLLLMMVKYKKIYDKVLACGIIIFEAITLNVFFKTVSGNGQGICDGIACYFQKLLNSYTGFTDTLYFILLLLLTGAVLFLIRNRAIIIINAGFGLICGAILLMLFFAPGIPIENSNKASEYVSDYKIVADYVNENANQVIYISAGDYSDPVLRSSAYIKKDYKVLFIQDDVESIEVEQDNTVLIVSSDWGEYGLNGAVEQIDTQGEHIRIYLAQAGMLEVVREKYMISFSSYSNLQGGYDENGRRYLNKDGVSYGPYIALAEGTYYIRVTGELLEQSMVSAYSGNGSDLLELTKLNISDSEQIFELKLVNGVEDFEVAVRNIGNDVVILDSIEIERILD